MNNFEYSAGTVVMFGKGQMENLGDAVKQYGQKVLLVYGGGSIKKSGLYDTVKRGLSDCQIFELAGVEPNPRIRSVDEGVKICKENDVGLLPGLQRHPFPGK